MAWNRPGLSPAAASPAPTPSPAELLGHPAPTGLERPEREVTSSIASGPLPGGRRCFPSGRSWAACAGNGAGQAETQLRAGAPCDSLCQPPGPAPAEEGTWARSQESQLTECGKTCVGFFTQTPAGGRSWGGLPGRGLGGSRGQGKRRTALRAGTSDAKVWGQEGSVIASQSGTSARWAGLQGNLMPSPRALTALGTAPILESPHRLPGWATGPCQASWGAGGP